MRILSILGKVHPHYANNLFINLIECISLSFSVPAATLTLQPPSSHNIICFSFHRARYRPTHDSGVTRSFPEANHAPLLRPVTRSSSFLAAVRLSLAGCRMTFGGQGTLEGNLILLSGPKRFEWADLKLN